MQLTHQLLWVSVTLFSAHFVLMSPIAASLVTNHTRDFNNSFLTNDIRNLSEVIQPAPLDSANSLLLETLERWYQNAFKLLKSDWKSQRWSGEPLSCDEANTLVAAARTDIVTLPPDLCGLCPTSGPEGGLYPCTCVNNGGLLGGTISIDCPPEVSSQEILRDIIQRTHFLTTNVSRFSLTDSNITGVLDLKMLGPLTVRVLILDDDLFQDVDNHAFNTSEQTLNTISLANNLIAYFHFDSVAAIPLLKSLDLSGNLLEFIPTQAFMHPHLQFLDLSRNNVYTLSSEAFLGLSSVEIIDLSANNLSELQQNTFKITNHDVNKVLEIDISNNYLRYISPDAFADLNNLQVNLSNNELTTIDSAVFRPPIENSGYFAQFILDGNPIICDCGIFWIISDSMLTNCFDNFQCHDVNATLYQLNPDDYLSCSESTPQNEQYLIANGASRLAGRHPAGGFLMAVGHQSSAVVKAEGSLVITFSQETARTGQDDHYGHYEGNNDLRGHVNMPW